MSRQKLFANTIQDELPRFERVWKALPADKLDYRSHERNQSAKQILQSMTFEAMMYPVGLRDGIVKLHEQTPPKSESRDELWSLFRNHLQQAASLAESLSDEDWNSPAKEYVGDRIVLETNKEGFAWAFLFDLIHHRGQLSVYIRPMGGQVPSIYGPSGDAPG